MPSDKNKPLKTVNLALQGGGAHGAYSWGVLDKILEDGRLKIDGICATSAGTMNACALAYGYHLGGAEKARETLHDFWWNVHQAGQTYSPIRRMPWERSFFGGFGNWNMESSLSYLAFETLTHAFSPYQFNPFDHNPLREILEKTVDFEVLRSCNQIKLFISATHVRTGRVRIFNAEHMNIDVAMASACLPFLFKAVKVNKDYYWDGGYVGNPALFPLFYETQTRDILIVHINPLERPDIPESAMEINNRINEISFNDSLLKEIRAIAFVKKLLDKNMLKDEYRDKFTNMLIHSIHDDKTMRTLSVASKFDSDWEFLTYLRDKGRASAEKWLNKNFDSIGKNDTVDLDKDYLYSITRMFEDS